jgi:hypothetical protein
MMVKKMLKERRRCRTMPLWKSVGVLKIEDIDDDDDDGVVVVVDGCFGGG